MTLGPFLFGAPLALLGLIALPIIWYILRATPPTPKQADLPSLRLLDGFELRDETPAKTPWWILLLRLLAAIAAILGLAHPIYAPGAKSDSSIAGPILVVIDDGWTSTQRWSEMRDAALSALDGQNRDTPAHLLLTAPRALDADPATRHARSGFETRIRSLQPNPWTVDRSDALTRLNNSGLSPTQIIWITNGLDPESSAPFASALAAKAPLSIYAATPRGPIAITGLSADANGATLNLRRVNSANASNHFVSALTLDGAALATSEASFAPGDVAATATFALPPAALSRVARFQVTATNTIGNVWLWDSADRSRRVGLVSGDSTAQPLLSDMHYIRKALEPFATITEGALDQLIADNPDAIILTDIGQIDPRAIDELTTWVEGGGALIRFAGPRMAAQGDRFVPAPLRRSSRAIGGALTWEEPQPLGPFPETSPFAGLTPPQDVTVRQQVLARPGPDLARRTWARLADGSPLVTADQRGSGMLILYHVTAGPDWSNLSFSGVFVEMLRRTIAAGKGEAVPDEDDLYTPLLSLNASGRLTQPDANATPLQGADFSETTPSQTYPPGLYQGSAGIRALNIAADYNPVAVTAWPAEATLLGDAEARTTRLGGLLLSLCIGLLALDLMLALAIAGRLPRLSRNSAGLLISALTLSTLIILPDASAQTIDIKSKEAQAALDMRLAYIETGDTRTDRTTRAGLTGLSLTLTRRSSVEPAEPDAVNPETDALDVYPILFLSLPETLEPFSPTAVARLNDYMLGGGALFIDTRRGGSITGGNSFDGLDTLLQGLDTPPLSLVSDDHVLTRSFYLLDDFPGRYSNRRLWIEATVAATPGERRGDGVSRLFVGDADYLAAWAVDDVGRPLFSVDGGDQQREMALRFGINLVVYVLTGNYKEDQVHLPALLERLGEEDEDPGPDIEVIP